MRLACLLAFLFLLIGSAPAAIVINELCYDPEGDDTGKEWIELYNNGEQSVNLEGARIEVAGSSFTGVYTLPHFVLRPGRCLLIAGSLVTEAVLISGFTFQNGGAETDGVRYVSPSGNYTDTVLYDSPNSNQLPDDTGSPATSFAPDVPPGYSLARRVNGLDTNDCEIDFIAVASPSPGLLNPINCDYALYRAELIPLSSADYRVDAFIRNLSDLSPVHFAELSLLLNGTVLQSQDIAPISAGDSLSCSFQISLPEHTYSQLNLLVNLPGDPDPQNNSIDLDWLQDNWLLKLTEVMYYPETGKPEWVEIELTGHTNPASSFRLVDASGNGGSFKAPSSPGRYVLVADSLALMTAHPSCPQTAIIRCTIPSLNNTGDTIRLFRLGSAAPVPIDSCTYSSSATIQGFSLERVENTDIWRQSTSPTGSSPGLLNQTTPGEIPQISGRLELRGSPFRARQGESLQIIYKLPEQANTANCFVYDQSGRRKRVLANNSAIGSEGVIIWDGRDNEGKIMTPGLYFIVWESRAGSQGRIYRRQTTAVLSN